MRIFPLLSQHQRRLIDPIPWSLVEPHRAQAMYNHGQTLERLAERGGLSLCELAAVLEDRKWRKMTVEEELAAVQAAIERGKTTENK